MKRTKTAVCVRECKFCGALVKKNNSCTEWANCLNVTLEAEMKLKELSKQVAKDTRAILNKPQ